MNNPLRTLGAVPVRATVLGSLFPDLSAKNRKIASLEQKGALIRLKKGMYVVSPEVTGVPLSLELVANHLYSPSYVSMSSALRYYGLIPEAVYTLQSMTTKHARIFENALGRFSYTSISREAFAVGLHREQRDAFVAFIIASPEKALCDLIAASPMVNLRYLKEAETYLEEDIRLDMDAFRSMDVAVFKDYAQVGKKAESIRTIIKLLER